MCVVMSSQFGTRSRDLDLECPSGIYTRTTTFYLVCNDLPQMVKRDEVRQYADDTTLSPACKDP